MSSGDQYTDLGIRLRPSRDDVERSFLGIVRSPLIENVIERSAMNSERVSENTARISKSTERPKSLELFAGAGGMALGLHFAGFEHTALVEIEAKACTTLRHNATLWQMRNGLLPLWKPTAVHQIDVCQLLDNASLHQGTLDLIAGGPPCQPFSLGGVHAGMNDSRNMFPAALEIVRGLQPKFVLFENVAGLLRSGFLPYFDYVEMQLRDPLCVPKKGEEWQRHRDRLTRRKPQSSSSSYLVTRQLVNTADFGIPQLRKRVLLMAIRADLADSPIPLLKTTHSEAALRAEQWGSNNYWERHGLTPPTVSSEREHRANHKKHRLTELPWRTVRDAIAGLPEPMNGIESPGVSNHVGVPGARCYPGHTGSEIDWPSKTIKAGVHGVCGGEAMIRYSDGRLRYMTVREAARIQTFPDDYEFVGARSHAMRHIGNAVPVELARAVGRHIRAHAEW